MVIGERLRQLRERKNLSQGDIEDRTGLLRCYVSRVEGGYTTPSLDTLEKFARALETTMYQLLYEGEGEPAPARSLAKLKKPKLWGSSGAAAGMVMEFRKLFSRMNKKDRQVLMLTARKMLAARQRRQINPLRP